MKTVIVEGQDGGGQFDRVKINAIWNNVRHGGSVFLFYVTLYIVFFSPVILSSKLFPSDGQLPAFFSPFELWSDLLLSGFPVSADLNWQAMYPLRYLFSLLPDGVNFNLYILSAYILASSFAYGYAYTLTHSRFSGLIGGIVYGMSGFMMVHLGHTSMIHAALWLPLIVWSLEKLRNCFSIAWSLVAILAISNCFLANHSQIFIYSLLLCTMYVIFGGWTSKIGFWRYFFTYTVIVTFACFLTAVDIIPSIQFANLSVRESMSFGVFNTYSVPSIQLLEIVFPWLFGGIHSSLYPVPYFGDWNLTEMSVYFGLLPLILALIGLLSRHCQVFVIYWLIMVLVSCLLALGDETPLSRLMYYIPAVNKFRAPSRHFLEMSFAMSALASLGVHSIECGSTSRRCVILSVSILSLVIIAVFSIVLYFYNFFVILAQQKGVTLFPAQNNLALVVPVMIAIVSFVALFYWSLSVKNRIRQSALIAILVVDMGSFGWFCEWRYAASNSDVLTRPDYAIKYQTILDENMQRLMPIDGCRSSIFAPNLSKLYGISSASGYGPLVLKRYADLLGVVPWGALGSASLLQNNRALDILAIRFVTSPWRTQTMQRFSTQWNAEDLPGIMIGSACGLTNPVHYRFLLPEGVDATNMSVVTTMGCSTTIKQNREVVKMILTDVSGSTVELGIRAGIDTSEGAYECDDVRPVVQHDRAAIFSSHSVGGYWDCQENEYYTNIPLTGNRYVQIDLVGNGEPGIVHIKKINLTDERTGSVHPLSIRDAFFSDPERWQHVEDIGEASVYQNLRAMPRAWLVPEVFSAKQQDVLNAVHTSFLPDGRKYQPDQLALVEEPFDFKSEEPDAHASASVVHLTSTRVEVRTVSQSPAFLVLSDVNYPGWTASIDGTDVHLFQTDYVLRGVMVPAGTHAVRFEFRPHAFYLGAVLTCISAIIVVSLWLSRFFWKRSRSASSEA